MNAVLIVDDTATVRTDLADALEAAGFRAVSCASVAEARTALRTQPIALAILDDQLPDGTGIELLELIRRDHLLSELPVLILARYAEVAERIISLQRGANDYVGKPYDTVAVVNRVRDLLGA